MELQLGDIFLFHLSQPLLVAELERNFLVGAHGANHLHVVDPCLVEFRGHELSRVNRVEVLHNVAREARPQLAEDSAVGRVGEGQVLHQMRHVGHPAIQVLVAPARCELQVAGHARNVQLALHVAALFEFLVVLAPRVRLRLHSPFNPSLHFVFLPVAVEDGEGPVSLVQPEGGVRVDAQLVALLPEIHAIHLDQPDRPHDLAAVQELHVLDGLGQVVPGRRELLAVAAPASEEVDEGEVVTLDDVIETLVLEAVVRAAPVSVQLRLAVLLAHRLHLFLVLGLANVLVVVAGGLRTSRRRAGDPTIDVHRPQGEILRLGHPLLGAPREHGHLEVAALNVIKLHI
mmetsp:Transcript_121395/g.329666  ORF Transcript_121395/g.329666 Transcript_121395/m.329666 type:complete len:344 (+) Transcript_121395:324-1355(+)